MKGLTKSISTRRTKVALDTASGIFLSTSLKKETRLSDQAIAPKLEELDPDFTKCAEELGVGKCTEVSTTSKGLI